MKNPNFLILDEPTNDLDLFTLNALEDYLKNFPGCLIIVSHDRFFMDKMTDHLLVFEGEGKVKDINGNYTAYRELKKAELSEKKQQPKPQKTAIGQDKPKTKLSFNEKREFESLEKEIEQLEREKVELTGELNSGLTDSVRIMEISGRLTAIVKDLDEKELRWLELSEFV